MYTLSFPPFTSLFTPENRRITSPQPFPGCKKNDNDAAQLISHWLKKICQQTTRSNINLISEREQAKHFRRSSGQRCRLLSQGEIIIQINSLLKSFSEVPGWFLTKQLHTAPAAHTHCNKSTSNSAVDIKGRAITHCMSTLSSRATIKEFINSSVIPGCPVEAFYARRLWQESVHYQHVNQLRFSDAH